MKSEPYEYNRLSIEAARLCKAESILLGLADTVSRGRFGIVDIPKELRRIAAELRDGAGALGRIADAHGMEESARMLPGA